MKIALDLANSFINMTFSYFAKSRISIVAHVFISYRDENKPENWHDSMASVCQKYWAGATRRDLDRYRNF